MTKFTVTWDDDAVNDLAEIWMTTQRRAAVSVASHDIDRVLAYDAHTQGREVSEGLRRLTVAPLAVLFEVSLDDRVAKVLRVVELP